MKIRNKLVLIMLIVLVSPILLINLNTQSVAVTEEKTIEEGIYKIVLANATNKSVTIAGGSTQNSANVHIWEYEDSPYQEFKFVYDGNGYYEIIAVNSGKRLDAAGWGNGVNIEQWSEKKNTDSQKWKI